MLTIRKTMQSLLKLDSIVLGITLKNQLVKIQAHLLNVSVIIHTKAMIFYQQPTIKLNVKQQVVNVLIIDIYLSMVLKISNVVVNILINNMILLNSIVNHVHVKLLTLDGHVPVDINLDSIKLFIKNKLRRKKKGKLLDINKEQSSAIVVCQMELNVFRQESKKKSKRKE